MTYSSVIWLIDGQLLGYLSRSYAQLLQATELCRNDPDPKHFEDHHEVKVDQITTNHSRAYTNSHQRRSNSHQRRSMFLSDRLC